jgi:CMP-N,N'-diacetyllegionaminic acid synthase
MINEKRVLAIIPARSGSKGLPGKNVRELCGKPLIAWSIEAGIGSRFVDEVVVTTDSEDIARISRNYGASVPFIRPAELASDTATSIDVVKHAIKFYREELKKEFDYVVMLEPTSPLRDSFDIDKAFEKLLSNPHALAIVGICKTESQNPAFLATIDDANCLVGYENSDMKVLRRQEISEVFFFEGSVYISLIDVLLNRGTFYHDRTLGYEVPKWKSPEIDDLDDFIIVEALMKHRGLC